MLTVEGLTLGEADSCCVLLFDDDVALNIEIDEPVGRLILSIFLDTIPDEPAAELLRELLAANFYWNRHRRCHALPGELNGFPLPDSAVRIPDLDEARFEQAIENMLEMAERWRDRIAAPPQRRGGKESWRHGRRGRRISGNSRHPHLRLTSAKDPERGLISLENLLRRSSSPFVEKRLEGVGKHLRVAAVHLGLQQQVLCVCRQGEGTNLRRRTCGDAQQCP